MGLFRTLNINEGVRLYASTPDAVLVDVREAGEYAEGHIPGSVNLPPDGFRTPEAVLPDPSTPLFLYCYTGIRSARAAKLLAAKGYQNVTNIGGLIRYRGPLERNHFTVDLSRYMEDVSLANETMQKYFRRWFNY